VLQHFVPVTGTATGDYAFRGLVFERISARELQGSAFAGEPRHRQLVEMKTIDGLWTIFGAWSNRGEAVASQDEPRGWLATTPPRVARLPVLGSRLHKTLPGPRRPLLLLSTPLNLPSRMQERIDYFF
jgi:hypothetical protein